MNCDEDGPKPPVFDSPSPDQHRRHRPSPREALPTRISRTYRPPCDRSACVKPVYRMDTYLYKHLPYLYLTPHNYSYFVTLLLAVDMADTSTMVRLYVGGLAPNLSACDLKARFASFGSVRGVEIARSALSHDECRGFAYVDLEANEAALIRCMKAYSGTKWHGRQLVVEYARSDYMARLQVLRTCMP